MPFDKFIECHNSYLFNRQVVMLANLTEDTCPPLGGYSQVKADMQKPEKRLVRDLDWQQLLFSAKDNLRKLDFFGLASEQQLTQELFEWTLKVRFSKEFRQSNKTRTVKTKPSFPQASMDKLMDVLGPEMDLYKYARDLFYKRVENMKQHKSDQNANL